MTPKRKSSSKKATKESSSKRRCTSIKKEEDEVSAPTTNTNDFDVNVNINNNELPTPVQLSEELCTIVSKRYSRDEALCTLDRLIKWAKETDPEFLKSFDTHGGVAKVLDFLETTMVDLNCVGDIRMGCIEKGARVLELICRIKQDDSNKEIATKIATSVINYNGIHTLINASEEYSGGDDVPQLPALFYVWAALTNISRITTAIYKNSINKDKANILFDAGIDVLSQLKSNYRYGRVVSRVLGNVFITLTKLVRCNYVEKKQFQDKNILSKCLDVFRMDGSWSDRSKAGTENAMRFFYWCQYHKLLDRNADFEMLLPFVVISLKRVGLSNYSSILFIALNLINGACKCMNDKKVIERSGVMEPLGVLLASTDTNEQQKNEIRQCIVMITAPETHPHVPSFISF